MSPTTRLVLVAALLPVNLLIGTLAPAYSVAWWLAAVGFTATTVALAGSTRVEPTPAGGGGDRS